MALATPIIAATYAEIALKGRNRAMFLRRLMNNVRTALKGEPVASINHIESRILVFLDDANAAESVSAKMRNVFGLQWVSPTVPIPRRDIDAELAEAQAENREPSLKAVCDVACALTAADKGQAKTFKVATRRSDRSFGLTSPEISRIVGGAVYMDCGLPAHMTQPEFVVNVLVLKDNILVFTGKEVAWGGLPIGSSGRIMVLLSGGIDSPVAAWLMMRRGCRPEFIHYYSGRNIEEADVEKIKDLVKTLRSYAPVPLTMYLVPVVPYEMRSIGVVPDRYDMVMFRRFMFCCASRMARRNSCKALISGDSVGQVASQTLSNLGAITSDLEIPILRPLIGMDKMEITAWSRKIGVYETSILPYRDCCSIRSPKPVLNARAQELLQYSEEMQLDEAVTEAMKATVKVVID